MHNLRKHQNQSVNKTNILLCYLKNDDEQNPPPSQLWWTKLSNNASSSPVSPSPSLPPPPPAREVSSERYLFQGFLDRALCPNADSPLLKISGTLDQSHFHCHSVSWPKPILLSPKTALSIAAHPPTVGAAKPVSLLSGSPNRVSSRSPIPQILYSDPLPHPFGSGPARDDSAFSSGKRTAAEA